MLRSVEFEFEAKETKELVNVEEQVLSVHSLVV